MLLATFQRMLALLSPWSSTDLVDWLTFQEKPQPFSQKPRNYTSNDTELHAEISKFPSHLACILLILALCAVQHYQQHKTISSRKGGALCFLVAGKESLNGI